MSASSSSSSLAWLGVAALFVAVVAVASQRKFSTRPSCCVDNEDNESCDMPVVPLIPLGAEHFAYDSIIVRNSSMNSSHQFHSQWHLAERDHGAISFECCAERGGLVVYLVDHPNERTLKDSRGYAIVLDNQGASVSETYIAALPGFPSKHRGSRTNRGFTTSSCQKYWIVYDRGTVLVGSGGRPGSPDAKLITCLQHDADAPTDVYWFGFGALRRDEIGMTVRNIRTFDAPPAGCSWSAAVPQRCSSLDPSPA